MIILNQVVALMERAWSEHYITAVFRSARDALILTSDDGVIKRVNPAALELLGYGPGKRETIVGHSFNE